jgi:hypothetical protein
MVMAVSVMRVRMAGMVVGMVVIVMMRVGHLRQE